MSMPIELDEAKALIALRGCTANGHDPACPTWYDGVKVHWLSLDRVLVFFMRDNESGAHTVVRSFEFDITRAELNSHEYWEEPPSDADKETEF